MDRTLKRNLSLLSQDQKSVYALILRQLQEDGTISSETEDAYLDQLGVGETLPTELAEFQEEVNELQAVIDEDEVCELQTNFIQSDKFSPFCCF